jgi:hypothetical protein
VSKASSATNAEQAAINTRPGKASVEAATSSPSIIGRAYERFLELPVAFVLLVLWVAGVAMLGSALLLAYAVISTLVWGW